MTGSIDIFTALKFSLPCAKLVKPQCELRRKGLCSKERFSVRWLGEHGKSRCARRFFLEVRVANTSNTSW